MNHSALLIDIPFQQPLEIAIEFPLSVLGGYNGISNLDETWDDTIMPVIHTALLENGIYIKNSKLDMLPAEKGQEECLSYRLLLIVPPPFVDLNCIVADLKKENLQKGLCIKRVINETDFGVLFSD